MFQPDELKRTAVVVCRNRVGSLGTVLRLRGWGSPDRGTRSPADTQTARSYGFTSWQELLSQT